MNSAISKYEAKFSTKSFKALLHSLTSATFRSLLSSPHYREFYKNVFIELLYCMHTWSENIHASPDALLNINFTLKIIKNASLANCNATKFVSIGCSHLHLLLICSWCTYIVTAVWWLMYIHIYAMLLIVTECVKKGK